MAITYEAVCEIYRMTSRAITRLEQFDNLQWSDETHELNKQIRKEIVSRMKAEAEELRQLASEHEAFLIQSIKGLDRFTDISASVVFSVLGMTHSAVVYAFHRERSTEVDAAGRRPGFDGLYVEGNQRAGIEREAAIANLTGRGEVECSSHADILDGLTGQNGRLARYLASAGRDVVTVGDLRNEIDPLSGARVFEDEYIDNEAIKKAVRRANKAMAGTGISWSADGAVIRKNAK